MCVMGQKKKEVELGGYNSFSNPEIFISGVDFVLFVNVAFQKQKSLLFVWVNT